jgi:hypothetical protein
MAGAGATSPFAGTSPTRRDEAAQASCSSRSDGGHGFDQPPAGAGPVGGRRCAEAKSQAKIVEEELRRGVGGIRQRLASRRGEERRERERRDGDNVWAPSDLAR